MFRIELGCLPPSGHSFGVDGILNVERPMLNAKMAVREAKGTDELRASAQHESVADSLTRIADLLRLIRGQFLEMRTLQPPERGAADRETKPARG